MKDPFPFQPIPWLSEWSRPFANRLGLYVLPLHIHEIVYSAALYFVIFYAISPAFSHLFASKYYSHLSHKKRLNWDAHVVAMIQALLISGVALWVLFTDEERMNMDRDGRMWGYTGGCGLIAALAVGYFVWDLVVTSLNLDVFGIGTLVHAIAALTAFSLGFRPFVNYYACNFILWEISTPFLNIHWFLDKVNMTGTKLQLYNGILLIFTFFASRLVYGNYSAVKVFSDIYYTMDKHPRTPGQGVLLHVTADASIPSWLAFAYVASNAALTTLNVYWFYMMVKAVRKRFVPADTKVGKSANNVITTDELSASLATGISTSPKPISRRA